MPSFRLGELVYKHFLDLVEKTANSIFMAFILVFITIIIVFTYVFVNNAFNSIFNQGGASGEWTEASKVALSYGIKSYDTLLSTSDMITVLLIVLAILSTVIAILKKTS
jgi:Flp pilus assembly pilin Flp